MVVEMLTGESVSPLKRGFHKISSIHSLVCIKSFHVIIRSSAFNVRVRCYWRRGPSRAPWK